MKFILLVVIVVLVLLMGDASAADTATPAAAQTGYAVDWGPFLNDLLLAVGAVVTAVLGTLGTIIGAKLNAKYGINVSDAQKAQAEDAWNKSMAWAIMQGQAEIKANGWDHVQTQSAITAAAANYAIAQFPGATKAIGFDISTPEARAATAAKLDATVMTRLLPDAMTKAAASPATAAAPTAPPTVVVQPVVVPPDPLPNAGTKLP